MSNNKRIAKNTGMLYMRMLLTMAVRLYTSRVVLDVLGIEEYGLYNVVGGVVVMLSFLNSAMASATQRFLTFEIGKNDANQLSKVFNTSVLIHLVIAFIILLFAETIGLWFLHNKMTIPLGRMEAAEWVYQFSVLSTIVMIMSVPYNAVIIAHEKMSAFAYISVLEVILKLAIVFMLDYFEYDKLKLYALLIFGVSLINRFVYGVYCKRNFVETHFKRTWDKALFIEMIKFASWSLFGNLSAVGFTQGVNLLLNIFFSPVVNAARAIAVQVQISIMGFVSNFQTALNPQIVKSYASGDFKYLYQLIYSSSKYSFFLLLLLSLPVFIEVDYILNIWLKVVPEHTINFLRLVLMTSLLESLANPLITAAQATGEIRKYQTVVGGILLLIVPFSYLLLKLGAPAESVFIVHFVVALIAQLVRLYFLKSMIKLDLRKYFNRVAIRVILVLLLSVPIPLLLHLFVQSSFFSFLGVCMLSTVSVVVAVFRVGLSVSEREFAQQKLKAFYLSKK